MKPHSHTCHACRRTWACREKRCKAEAAAKVNKRGPYCTACFHGIMFLRYAVIHGQPLTALHALLVHERAMAKLRAAGD